MVIFHSYVSLPEGISNQLNFNDKDEKKINLNPEWGTILRHFLNDHRPRRVNDGYRPKIPFPHFLGPNYVEIPYIHHGF